MKTLINQEEKTIAEDIYKLAKMMPDEVLKDFRTMLITAKMLLKNNDDKKGA